MNPHHDPLKAFFDDEEADEMDSLAAQEGEEWDDDLGLDVSQGEGVELLHEAHEAINKLYQKTNNRGKLMRQPRRADSWQ